MNKVITTQIPFSRPDTTVASGKGVILSENSPLTGKVISIIIHFPGGCNSLVEIICYINQLQILPLQGFIALDDDTVTFPVKRAVDGKDKLRVKIENKDTTNSHTPSIIWNLEGEP